jgi:hypothetical protein
VSNSIQTRAALLAMITNSGHSALNRTVGRKNMDVAWEVGAAVGAGIGIFSIYRYFQLRSVGKASAAWPKTAGRIVKSAITERKSDNEGESDNIPTLEYTYDVDRNNYSGNNISYKVISLTRPAAEKILEKYPIGATADVYYNPSKPSQSVLEPGVHQPPMTLLIVGSILLPISLLAMLWT